MSAAASGASERVIGVDLGGTTFTVGLFDQAGCKVADGEYGTPRSGDDPCAVLEALKAAAEQVRDAAGVAPAAVRAIGIGIPGPVEPETGTVFMCPNLHVLDGVAVGPLLGRMVGVPCHIGNDAYCATLAELRYGAGRDVRNMVMLTLGTGIGGGVALDDQVVRGPRRILGEIGHVIVDPQGPKCGCGSFGCVEALAGKQGIIDDALRRLQAGQPSRLAAVPPTELDPRCIAEAAEEGDELALAVLERTGNLIGIALCSAIVLTDPDLIVLGGGIAAAGHLLLGPVRRTVAARCRIGQGFDVSHIVPAALGNEAGVCGAAALAWERSGGICAR